MYIDQKNQQTNIRTKTLSNTAPARISFNSEKVFRWRNRRKLFVL